MDGDWKPYFPEFIFEEFTARDTLTGEVREVKRAIYSERHAKFNREFKEAEEKKNAIEDSSTKPHS